MTRSGRISPSIDASFRATASVNIGAKPHIAHPCAGDAGGNAHAGAHPFYPVVDRGIGQEFATFGTDEVVNVEDIDVIVDVHTRDRLVFMGSHRPLPART